jgi:hypothetical protein
MIRRPLHARPPRPATLDLSAPCSRGPRTAKPVQVLVLEMARDNPSWGYRIHASWPGSGTSSPPTVWQILKDAGIDPAPRRSWQTWRAFLETQAKTILVADFFHVGTVFLRRLYVSVTWNPSAAPAACI